MLLPVAGSILEADERNAPRLGEATVRGIVDLVPEEWLAGRERRSYAEYLLRRLTAQPRAFAAEAEEARRGA